MGFVNGFTNVAHGFFYDELVNFPQHDTAVVSLCLLYVFIRNIRIFETVDFVFKEHLSCTAAVCRYKTYFKPNSGIMYQTFFYCKHINKHNNRNTIQSTKS